MAQFFGMNLKPAGNFCYDHFIQFLKINILIFITIAREFTPTKRLAIFETKFQIIPGN